MKLLYRTLHKKQRFLSSILTILLFLSLFSIQISLTVFMKNQTFSENISNRQLAQSSVFANLNTPTMYDRLDEYKETFNVDYSYEKSYAYPYYGYSNGSFSPLGEVYLEGYVKSADNYPLLEGKKLSDLQGNEIAVMESYAKKLRTQSIDPYQYKISLRLENGKSELFQIKSIIDYPNFNHSYEGQASMMEMSSLFQSSRCIPAIAPYDTVKKLCQQTSANGERTQLGSYLAKVHYKKYNRTEENEFRQGYYMNYDDEAFNTDFRLLGDEMNATKVNDSIFQFVALSVCGLLMFTCFFVLYAFFKRKLLEDKEKVMILIANGIAKKNIRGTYLREELQLFLTAIVLLILTNIGLYVIMQNQQEYVLQTLFLLSKPVILWLSIGVILFFSLLMLLLIVQVHANFRANLTLSLKLKNVHITIPKKRITYRRWSLHMAIRDIVTRPFSSMRNVFSISMILVTMLLLLTTNSILTHLYNEDTFGMKFDYLIADGMKYDDFDTLSNTYFKHYAFLDPSEGSGVQKAFIVDDLSTRDENKFEFYPGMFFVIRGELDEFVTLKEGKYPPSATPDSGGEGYLGDVYAMIPRRLSHDFKLYYKDAPEVLKDNTLLLQTYVGFGDGNTTRMWGSFPIYGYTESIINNGYVVFASLTMGPVDASYYTTMPTMMIRLDKGVDKRDFEQKLKATDVKYQNYDSILQSMQLGNDQINTQLYFIMWCVGILCLLTMTITIYANIRSDVMEKKKATDCLKKIGIANDFRLRRDILQQIVVICLAFPLTALLYVILQYPYFDMLGKFIGLYDLPAANGWIVYGFAGVGLMFCILILCLSIQKHKKHVG